MAKVKIHINHVSCIDYVTFHERMGALTQSQLLILTLNLLIVHIWNQHKAYFFLYINSFSFIVSVIIGPSWSLLTVLIPKTVNYIFTKTSF